MNKMTYFNRWVLVILFPFQILCTRDNSSDASSFTKGCFGIAAGAALIGAAALAVDYFFRPTDQQQYDKAVDLYNQLRSKRSVFLSTFIGSFNIEGLSFYEKQRIINAYNEDFLNQIAWELWTNKEQVSLFPETISQEAASLEGYVKDLTKRVTALRTKRDISSFEVDLAYKIEAFLRTISYSSELLVLLADYCKKHAVYFQISELGWSLYDQYEPELIIIEQYRYDMYQLMTALHEIITSKKNADWFATSYRYPYITYVDSLSANLLRLEIMRNKVLSVYPTRVEWLNTVVIPPLRWLRAALDPYYQSDLLYRRRAQLDEEIQTLRCKKAVDEVLCLERQRSELEYDYCNAINSLVIHIH